MHKDRLVSCSQLPVLLASYFARELLVPALILPKFERTLSSSSRIFFVKNLKEPPVLSLRF